METNPGLFQLFVVSLVVMGVAHTITKERIFASLRERIASKSDAFGYLVTCPYCASHWVSFILVPLTGSYYVPIIGGLGPFGWVLTWFFSSILIATLAAFLRVLFYVVDELQGLERRRQKAVETETELARIEREALRDGKREHRPTP